MKFDESLSNTQSAQVLKDIKEKADRLYALKMVSDLAEKDYKNAKNELSEIMEKAGVDKIIGDDCSISLALKSSCSVPKDMAAKQVVFNYITTTYNDVVLQGMLTINSRTFSSWVTKEVEKKNNEGDLDFKVPGTEPYQYYSLGMRKRAPKSK